jgi:hypothetical protein
MLGDEAEWARYTAGFHKIAGKKGQLDKFTFHTEVVGRGFPPALTERVFHVFDTNGNGKIELEVGKPHISGPSLPAVSFSQQRAAGVWWYS